MHHAGRTVRRLVRNQLAVVVSSHGRRGAGSHRARSRPTPSPQSPPNSPAYQPRRQRESTDPTARRRRTHGSSGFCGLQQQRVPILPRTRIVPYMMVRPVCMDVRATTGTPRRQTSACSARLNTSGFCIRNQGEENVRILDLRPSCADRTAAGESSCRQRWHRGLALLSWSTLLLVLSGCGPLRNWYHNGFKVGPNTVVRPPP